MVQGNVCTKFQVCTVFHLPRKGDTDTQKDQVKIGISSTGCSPHVDFDKSGNDSKVFFDINEFKRSVSFLDLSYNSVREESSNSLFERSTILQYNRRGRNSSSPSTSNGTCSTKVKQITLRKSMRNHNLTKCTKAKEKVIQMLFIVVLEFFVCWTPLYVMNTWYLYDPEAVQQIGSFCITMIHLLSYVSTCCNPITYVFMYKKFRTAFLQTIHCKQKRSHWNRNHTAYRSSTPGRSRVITSRATPGAEETAL